MGRVQDRGSEYPTCPYDERTAGPAGAYKCINLVTMRW